MEGHPGAAARRPQVVLCARGLSWRTLSGEPFKLTEAKGERTYTSLDCINIEKQLGYQYSRGSLDEPPIKRTLAKTAVAAGNSTKVVRVSKVNRASVRGSFLVSSFVTIDGKKYCLGTEAVLSRWSVNNCANCQTHLEVKAFFGLHGLPEATANAGEYEVVIHGRDGKITNQRTARRSIAPIADQSLFRMEVK